MGSHDVCAHVVCTCKMDICGQMHVCRTERMTVSSHCKVMMNEWSKNQYGHLLGCAELNMTQRNKRSDFYNSICFLVSTPKKSFSVVLIHYVNWSLTVMTYMFPCSQHSYIPRGLSDRSLAGDYAASEKE